MADDFKRLIPVVRACPIHGSTCYILGPLKYSKMQRRRVARAKLKKNLKKTMDNM